MNTKHTQTLSDENYSDMWQILNRINEYVGRLQTDIQRCTDKQLSLSELSDLFSHIDRESRTVTFWVRDLFFVLERAEQREQLAAVVDAWDGQPAHVVDRYLAQD